MAAKKNRFIFADLQWCEKHLKEWKTDVDNNPFDKIDDRWGRKETSTGGATHIIAATIEAQKNDIRKTMKDILELLPRINELREQEDKQKDIKLRKNFEDDESIL